MKTHGLMLPVGGLVVFCLAGGCSTDRSKPAVMAACCATNPQPAAAAAVALPTQSLYQIGSTWTTDEGEPLKLAALRGRPQIMAMFFTSCQNACPITVSDMKRIEAALPEKLRARVGFALVSFDPERDTVTALHAYRLRRGLDPVRWTMLRGEPGDVQELANRLGMKYKNGARGQFSHSNIITLLNPEGEIVRQQIGLNQSIDETVAMVQQVAVR